MMLDRAGGRNTMTYDGDGKRQRMEDSEGVHELVWDGENIDRQRDDGVWRAYTYAPEGYGRLVSMRRSGSGTSFYHFDALGSVRALTDSSQTVTDTRDYKAFGQTNASSGSTSNRFWWVGKLGYYHQPDTSDYWVRARVMRPPTGRWLSRDRVKVIAVDEQEPSVPDAYRYAGGSPLRHVDPSGNTKCVLVFHTDTRASNRGILILRAGGRYGGTRGATAYSGVVGCGGESQWVQCFGPIPAGSYRAQPWQNECQGKIRGPCMRLTHGQLCAGRSGFFIHRIQRTTPQSQGCIVLSAANLAELRRRMKRACCEYPVPTHVWHSVPSEGTCTATQVGRDENCNRTGAPVTCSVGCVPR